jgi:hypothetical protein
MVRRIRPRRVMVVGGRELDVTKDEVIRKMRVVEPEPIREHLVQIDSTAYPPKQVLAEITGWPRQSFTTMEANRVLLRLGFACRRAGALGPGGQPVWLAEDSEQHEAIALEQRLSAIESAMSVAQEAIAGLRNRLSDLEAGRQ